MKVLGFLSAFLIVGAVLYGGWILQKKLSHMISYEAMVEETVCKMVKPEHLKQPCSWET